MTVPGAMSSVHSSVSTPTAAGLAPAGTTPIPWSPCPGSPTAAHAATSNSRWRSPLPSALAPLITRPLPLLPGVQGGIIHVRVRSTTGDAGPAGVDVMKANVSVAYTHSFSHSTTAFPPPDPRLPCTVPASRRVLPERGGAGSARRVRSGLAPLAGSRPRWRAMATACPAELAPSGRLRVAAGCPRAISHDEGRTVITPTRPRTRLALLVPSPGPEAPCHTLENGATTSMSVTVPSDVCDTSASTTVT